MSLSLRRAHALGRPSRAAVLLMAPPPPSSSSRHVVTGGRLASSEGVPRELPRASSTSRLVVSHRTHFNHESVQLHDLTLAADVKLRVAFHAEVSRLAALQQSQAPATGGGHRASK